MWKDLTSETELEQIKKDSFNHPVAIFKHSTRCNISSMVLSRLKRDDAPEGIPIYYLDLIKYRPISNKIAEDFNIFHESPQMLLIKNGECIYDESHNAISMDELTEAVK